jgi:hypothetical protein
MARVNYGDGSGYGTGNGDGSGYGYGSERLKIEFQILRNIPEKELPLYMDIWEFEEVKQKFINRLGGNNGRSTNS